MDQTFQEIILLPNLIQNIIVFSLLSGLDSGESFQEKFHFVWNIFVSFDVFIVDFDQVKSLVHELASLVENLRSENWNVPELQRTMLMETCSFIQFTLRTEVCLVNQTELFLPLPMT